MLIYHAGKDISNSGGTAAEMLRKAPISSTLHLHRFRNKEMLDVDRTTYENGRETGRYDSILSGIMPSRIAPAICARKLTITLTTASPFGSYLPQQNVISSSAFHSVTLNHYLMRSVKISLNWEFGGMLKADSARKISKDDLKNVKQGG